MGYYTTKYANPRGTAGVVLVEGKSSMMLLSGLLPKRMIRVLICLSLLLCVSAFQPSARRVTNLMLRMEGEASTGAPAKQAPVEEAPAAPAVPAVAMSRSLPFLMQPKNIEGMVGDVGFDPLGFSDTFDVKFLREAELKHGRVAMLAVVGCLCTQAGIHLPSPNGMFDTTNIIDAPFKAGLSPLLQIILGVGFLESINHGGKMSVADMFEDSDREPGMFSNPMYGAFRLNSMSEEKIAEMKLKELKNGRLAMFGIGGIIHHQIIYGSETLGDFANFNPFAH